MLNGRVFSTEILITKMIIIGQQQEISKDLEPLTWQGIILAYNRPAFHSSVFEFLALCLQSNFQWTLHCSNIFVVYLTPWLMEPGDSMPHSEGLSNNPYPEPNQSNLLPIYLRSILILSSHLRLGLPKSLLPVGLLVFKHSQIFKIALIKLNLL